MHLFDANAQYLAAKVRRGAHTLDLNELAGPRAPEAQDAAAGAGRGRRRMQGGHVVGERPEQVALDGAQGGAGEPDGVGGGPQVAADQGEVGGLDGDVGAGAHGQAEVGLGERGGVVDAVADHGDDGALVLEALDDVDLVGGQHLGDDVLRVMPTCRARPRARRARCRR